MVVMSYGSLRLENGFSKLNQCRIYRGEPALSGNRLPANRLSKRQFEALALVAEGLTHEQVAKSLGISAAGVSNRVSDARSMLGIINRAQIAGFMPMDPGDEALRDKKLEDVAENPTDLEVLEAFSKGLVLDDVADEVGLTASSVNDRLKVINGILCEPHSTLQSLRIVNALRAIYVGVIESHPDEMGVHDIGRMTLPYVAELEPRAIDLMTTASG